MGRASAVPAAPASAGRRSPTRSPLRPSTSASSEADLRTKLGDGQSLADIAKAQSKDLAGLKTAILDAAKADLDKAVADKKLTQSQADDIYKA